MLQPIPVPSQPIGPFGWWHTPLGVRQGVWRMVTLLRVPNEDDWEAYYPVFGRLPAKTGITVHPGDYLLRGHYRARHRPAYSVGLAREDGIVWLNGDPRVVQRALRQHRLYIPHGSWQALRGAMLLASLSI